VITVAVNEINQKSDIYIEPEYKKFGRSVAGIQFYITENSTYQPSFKRLAPTVEQSLTNLQDKSILLEILFEEFQLKEKKAKEIIQHYELKYINEKIDLVRTGKNIQNPGAYLIAALKNDYKKMQNMSKIKKPEPTYIRETREASQIRSLKKKYIEFKFRIYSEFLEKNAKLEEVKKEFLHFIQVTNPVMGALYKRKELQSLTAMTEFIEYVDQKYTINSPSFDAFLTEEETI
jgi:hypothetical protein